MSRIIIQTKKTLKEPIRVCADCLDLLCLEGYINSNFVISKTIFKQDHICQICELRPADYLIIPSGRGIFICERCLRSLTTASKHRWQAWPKKPATKTTKCDLCGEPAVFHISLPKTKRTEQK